MTKIYKVQMNSKGAPDFSTAVEIPSSDNHDWEKYSDKLWKLAYERGKASVRPQGEVDAIDRDALIDYCLKLIDVERKQGSDVMNYGQERVNQTEAIIDYIEDMPHVNADRPQGEFTKREYEQFLHGISLSLLSKRSAQHWGYEEETAQKIRWLEALEQKVRARMKGADDE